MKIENNVYKKVCDMGNCKNIAQHFISYNNLSVSTDICRECLFKLYKEIKKVIYDKKGY